MLKSSHDEKSIWLLKVDKIKDKVRLTRTTFYNIHCRLLDYPRFFIASEEVQYKNTGVKSLLDANGEILFRGEFEDVYSSAGFDANSAVYILREDVFHTYNLYGISLIILRGDKIIKSIPLTECNYFGVYRDLYYIINAPSVTQQKGYDDLDLWFIHKGKILHYANNGKVKEVLLLPESRYHIIRLLMSTHEIEEISLNKVRRLFDDLSQAARYGYEVI